ncbi:hypothetical protein C1T17_13535 [Sphingobium sp. SCG-1]|uniref:TonB-dependent receptor n=1 Tax=Sphingobium sp. SCG-1 TaxID=2072936 RepID=UPI000CD6870B|nr:TonB-dependent receptor [Sphingobium sp. SCG-1]AUW58961.1 hypothetical protein C1T17_13535 [Sphingobium sp. SCG-1]
MKVVAKLLLNSACAIALAPAAYAQDAAPEASLEDIVVTGSRLVTNGNAAATPVTVLPTQQLLETKPTSISDALNSLPAFAASDSSRNLGTASSNSTGAYLNLRQFGVERNLILLDGNRLPPTAQSGAVDINLIPQPLIRSVEIVTGGASAVYGSDAVSGVINFILDKKYTGLKGTVQAGETRYGDNGNWRASLAGGADILGGRGHILGSFEYFDSNGVDRAGFNKRPGPDLSPKRVGAGTATDPFRIIYNARQIDIVPGGRISVPNPINPFASVNVPGLTDIFFPTNGVPRPFNYGVVNSGTASGGDGGVLDAAGLAAPLERISGFGRFDYDLSDNVRFYAQGSYNRTHTNYPYSILFFFPGANVKSGNPFIPASIQSIMTANNVQSITLSSLFTGEGRQEVRDATVKALFVKTGLEGELFENKVKWKLDYSYGRTSQKVYSINNVRADTTAAALDAVVDPASGNIVCQVSLTAAASRFPGCVPFNPFGPTAASLAAFDYITDDTYFTLTNAMHDISLQFTGSPFSLPAGEVQVSVNGEYRELSLKNESVVGTINCTGLRASNNCPHLYGLNYNSNITASVKASQNVKEFGGELLIPLLKDTPFFKSLELNLAGRYTDYSTSGTVTSWKVGGSWVPFQDLRVRGTYSKDIRAPTLIDLFQPTATNFAVFDDLHTGQTGGVPNSTRGNPNLVPEIAKTLTLGAIYQPSWLPRFSIAVDFFDIRIANAITDAGPALGFQRECEVSNGTSPYCANFVRPLPFSDRTIANYPIQLITQRVNAASQRTRGVDVEVNYRLEVPSPFSNAPGELAIRALGTYQPVLQTRTVSVVPATEQAGVAGLSKVRVNLLLNYSADRFNLTWTQRWQSKQQPSDRRVNFDQRKDIPAFTYSDLSLSYRLNVGKANVVPFFTVENLFDKKPPITGYEAGVGLGFPSPNGFDVLGRRITAGLRFDL